MLNKYSFFFIKKWLFLYGNKLIINKRCLIDLASGNEKCDDQEYYSGGEDFSPNLDPKRTKTYIWLTNNTDWDGLDKSKKACKGKKYSKYMRDWNLSRQPRLDSGFWIMQSFLSHKFSNL